MESMSSPPVIATSSLPGGSVGTAYSATLSANGGTTPLNWSIAAGSLPAGLKLDGISGILSGTPTTPGKSAFTLLVSDSKALTASVSLSIDIEGVVITTTSLPSGTIGAPYSATMSLNGGMGPDTWILASGSLPAGLVLSSNGTISGTPTAAGAEAFTVQVMDSESTPATATGNFSIAVAPTPTFAVIHNFTGGTDGSYPNGGLTMDSSGNFYGVSAGGGDSEWGTVYELVPSNGSWTHAVLYSFASGNDGAGPTGPLTLGADGSLYGTTSGGGGPGCRGAGCGTVFNLKMVAGKWTEMILHRFESTDGRFPGGAVIFDQAGNLYGTALSGYGIVYELTPSNGDWVENILYNFTGGEDGAMDSGTGVMFDKAGNLYGTTTFGGSGFAGVVYQLSPLGSGKWQQTVLYSFQRGSGGDELQSGVILDQAGNLYGTTSDGGNGGGGTAFKLTPGMGNWAYAVMHEFTGSFQGGPRANLVMDTAGNLYGTIAAGGAYGNGTVFKLTPWSGGWTYTSLHDFTGGSDGARPFSSVVLDGNGNLYGTTLDGGTGDGGTGYCSKGCGVVWEIIP